MYYRKASPETMRKNRENNKKLYSEQISWLKENVGKLTQNKHRFLIDMYSILITGNRKITPKMADAIDKSIDRCKKSPAYNEDLKEDADKQIKPILGKINMVKAMAEAKGDYSIDFINNVENYVRSHYRISKKQMQGLNKIYKRLSDNLFEGDKDE